MLVLIAEREHFHNFMSNHSFYKKIMCIFAAYERFD